MKCFLKITSLQKQAVNLSAQHINLAAYNSIAQVPDVVFSELIPAHAFYFSKAFLASFEINNTAIKYTYLVLSLTDKIMGFAIIQELLVDLDVAAAQLPVHTKLAKTAHCYISNRNSIIAVCGNVFLSGAYGVYIKDLTNSSSIYKTIAQYIKSSALGKKASVYFFKDFNALNQHYANRVTTKKYEPFPVAPNMILEIKDTWKSYEDYKNALKSKYRVKVNKADSMSAGIKVVSFTAAQIVDYRERLQILLHNITDRALVKTIDLNIATYASLKTAFPDRVLFNTYFFENELVGFAVAFLSKSTIDAHFIGMDYTINKQLSLYPRILNDYVRLAINHKVKTLNLGRTSSEIKSTLGAIPEPLVCYFRHKRTLANLIFKPLVRQLEATAYKQHSPFKS